jgi:uncharacterized protein (DUF2062 family)
MLAGRLLRQSVEPEKLALTMALGNTIGLSPVYGSTTVTSTAVALALGLNLPLIQAANWMVWPLQLTLILPFIRIGERLWDHPPLRLSRARIIDVFEQGPIAVVNELGWAIVHAFSAWLLAAFFIVPALYFFYLPLMRRLRHQDTGIGERAESRPNRSMR